MDERLQNMLDHFEITKTLSEYCHATDRCDEAGMRTVYAKDSWDDHGDVKAPGPEFARVMSESIRTTTRTLTHQLGQSLITIEGDAAGAETYFTAVATGPDEQGKPTCNFLGGRFVDRLIREEGRWLIKHRIVLRDWTLSLPADSEWIPALALRPGARSNADASCAVIGWPHGNG
jgi:hypothetical protein